MTEPTLWGVFKEEWPFLGVWVLCGVMVAYWIYKS